MFDATFFVAVSFLLFIAKNFSHLKGNNIENLILLSLLN